MTIQRLLVKDPDNNFDGKQVTFTGDIPRRVLCACCSNISSELVGDPRGHLYCISCLAMLDNEGMIDCVVDNTTHSIHDMQDRSERYLEALKLNATCPNEACSYSSTLKEVMGHYKRCGVRTAKCPLCKKDVHQKILSAHIKNICEQRLVNCPYCEMELEDRYLDGHMEDCDERPANCPYCDAEFDTFAELRDTHLATCPSKPVKCPYTRVGCNFESMAKDMEKHVGLCQHLTSLIDRILHLEAQLQEVQTSLLKERTENKELRQLIADKEDEYRKTDEYIRNNMLEELDELRTSIARVEKKVCETEADVRERLGALELRSALTEEPLEKLLAEIAQQK